MRVWVMVAYLIIGLAIATSSQAQDYDAWQTLHILRGHIDEVLSVCWSPDETMVASGSASGDRTIKIWDAQTGDELLTLRGHTAGVLSVAWSSDGSLLAFGSSDNTVRVWDAVSGEELLTLTEHTNRVNSVAWAPNSALLASGSDDRTVKVWDVTSGEALLTLGGHNDYVTSVRWSPDGSRLASGSFDRMVRIWNTQNWKLFRTLGHPDRVWSLSWSPDGAQLAAGSSDRTVRVWNIESMQPILSIPGHAAQVTSVDWSPDGMTLASTSGSTIRLSNAQSGALLRNLTGHEIKCIVGKHVLGLVIAYHSYREAAIGILAPTLNPIVVGHKDITSIPEGSSHRISVVVVLDIISRPPIDFLRVVQLPQSKHLVVAQADAAEQVIARIGHEQDGHAAEFSNGDASRITKERLRAGAVRITGDAGVRS